ncbi:hypothetical protein RBB50_005474 [Rhinocladiella similis]
MENVTVSSPSRPDHQDGYSGPSEIQSEVQGGRSRSHSIKESIEKDSEAFTGKCRQNLGPRSQAQPEEDVAVLWQEFSGLAPLDDLGLQTGNVIDFEDNSALSDEECAAQDDKAYNPETAGLALHDSVISETDTRASYPYCSTKTPPNLRK